MLKTAVKYTSVVRPRYGADNISMMRYLGRKFWGRLIIALLAMGVVFQGPRFFRPMAKTLTDLTPPPAATSDSVRTMAAAPQALSAATTELVRRLDAYYDTLTDDAEGHHWRLLNQEWMALGEQWFARLHPGDLLPYTRYATLWVDKRERVRQWRVDCRRQAFPEFSDDELYARADWFREQEEWREMQAKIRQGESEIEAKYRTDLAELLGPRQAAFERLHALYVGEQLGVEAVTGLFL